MDNLLQGNALPGVGDATASMPGYGFIAQIMLKTLGVDVGQIVSIYLLLFGLYQGGLMIYNKAHEYFLDNATSSVRIEDNDVLYTQFMSWVSEQKVTANSRDLKASSSVHVTQNDDSDYEDDEDDDDLLNEDGLFDYEKWSSVKPVHYEPNFGVDKFYHKGRLIQFEKGEKEKKYSHRWDKHVEIRCIGRSTQPIKDLLADIKELSRQKKTNNTYIYRPHAEGYWVCKAVRPSRPMSTVSLDMEQKKQIVQDVNEYLHPVTAQWYAARGIPHRRGYLFHGQPGTGKTSLSFALAGIFGLGIYCASLSDGDISESRLSTLFDQLPRRCLVLLEDIDSAGVRRDESSDVTDSDESDTESETSEQTRKSLLGRLTQRPRVSGAVEKAVEKKTEKKEKTKQNKGKGNVSLAGLLNVIDGAASAEGRVLIMTTNYPEKLDSALIRPGRVDLQTKFTLATHEQIRAIFTRMYSTDKDMKKMQKNKTDSDDGHVCANCSHSHNSSSSVAVELAPEKLAELAEKFAQELPDVMLSPAEIQGYLLMKKTDPTGAVTGAKEWSDKVLEAKRKGKKVVD